jgi:CubicO group peptidase (beta-lactamase class C family)
MSFVVASLVQATVAQASAPPAVSSPADTPSPAAVSGHPHVAQALELARVWLEGQQAYGQVPAVSAAIVHDQQVLWSGGSGRTDLAGGVPAGADTLYSICSISKLFTSIAVLQQRDAGRLRLDDPVQRHLPWFSLKRAEGDGDVTIEGLLTHSSGLPRESEHAYWSAPDFTFPQREDVMRTISGQEPLYAPATAFQYSNLGITLAGEIVAAAAGRSYDAYVREAILDPLGLRSTTPEMPQAERGKRLATGYGTLDRHGNRRPLPFFSTRAIAPAAGYASTVEDLARFASWQFRLLQTGGAEVLKATTLREMHRVHWAEPDFETLWGLGFAISRREGKTFVGHGGSCPGYRAHVLLMPEDKMATIVLANAQGVSANAWAQRLYDIVAPAVKAAGKEPSKAAGKEPSKAAAPDADLRQYAGTYDITPWGGELAVLPWLDGLAMVDLPTDEPVKEMTKLKKTGEHRFRRIRKDETLGEEIVFEMGPDGRPTRLLRHSNHYPRVR